MKFVLLFHKNIIVIKKRILLSILDFDFLTTLSCKMIINETKRTLKQYTHKKT